MMGARTLAGALVPLRGPAPTNFNFVAGDYNRVTGLKGNGVNKYLDSNRNNNSDPINSNHNAVLVSSPALLAGSVYIGGGGTANGANNIGRSTASPGSLFCRNRTSQLDLILNAAANTGLYCITRATVSQYTAQAGASLRIFSVNSQTPATATLTVFSRQGLQSFSDARLSYYSIGEAVDLAALDARVTTLQAAIAAALA
jgi:hypothetical protein